MWIDKIKLPKNVHFKEMLTGSVVAFVLQIIGMCLGYVLSLVIAHRYGARGSGILALTMTYVSIATVLAKAGLDISVMKFIARFHGDHDLLSIKGVYLKGLRIIILTSFLVSIIFYILSEPIAVRVLKKEYLIDAFRCSVMMIVPMALIGFHAEAMRGCKKIYHYFIVNRISVSALCLLLLIVNIEKLWSNHVYIDIFIISQSIVAISAICLWLISSDVLRVKVANAITTKKLFEASFPVVVYSSIALIMSWTDVVMLGAFRTEVEVGVYSIAIKLATFTSIALVAVNSIAAPKIAQLYGKKELDDLKQTLNQATKWIFMISAPILIMCVLFSGSIMGVFGSDFEVGATALIILAVAQFFNAISGPVGQVLNMTDNEKVLRNTALLAALVNLVLNYILIPLYGLNGAALATGVSIVLWNFTCVLCVYRKMGIWVIYVPFCSRYL